MCLKKKEKIIDGKLAFVLADLFPVTEYHSLIIPKRHFSNYFEIKREELLEMHYLLKLRKKQILAEDETVSGFNIGINVGHDAGQSIFHLHIHLIPRRAGDVKNPSGGIHGVIPNKKNYEIKEEKMNKLVRDKIPEIMKEKKQTFKTRTLKNDSEYLLALNKKLIEEVNEYIESSIEENAERIKYEIADILEVIEAICKLKKYEINVVQNYKLKKKREKGGFDKRVLLLLDK